VIPGPFLSGAGYLSVGPGLGQFLGGAGCPSVIPGPFLSGAGCPSVGPGLGIGPRLAGAAPRNLARGGGVFSSLTSDRGARLARGGEMCLVRARARTRGGDVVPGRAAGGPAAGPVGAGLGEFAGWRLAAVPSSWLWWPSSWPWTCSAVAGQRTSW
jgi:hypothetical protein